MTEAREMPLAGLNVLDLTRVVAGPYATALLADYGARVVKVEQPERGDDMRKMPNPVRELSVTFNDLNRNKEGLTLDLRDERCRDILLRLLPHFDVLAENYAAGTMERWDLGWETLHATNPRLVYVSLSGFGCDGPYAGRASYDLVSQAMSGVMALTGEADGPPLKTGVNLADYVGGVFMAFAILAALRERDRSGLGQHVDISNQDALTTMLDSALTWYRASGTEAQRHGNFHRVVAPFGAFQAKDGWVVITVASPRRFLSSLSTIGQVELLHDPEFVERFWRFETRGQITDLWKDFVADRTCQEVEAICLEHGVGCGTVKSVRDLATDPQLEHRGMLAEVEHPDGQGPMPTQGLSIKFLDTPGTIRHAAPTLSQHTEALLGELLGMTSEEIEALRKDGVI